MKFSKLKSFIRDYFTLTSRERKGALMLAIIIFIQISYIIWFNYFSEPLETATSKFKMEIIHFENETVPIVERKNFPKDHVSNPDFQTGTFVEPTHKIDPNNLSDAEWLNLGLSPKQTSTIRNYLNKGGVFRDKNALKKIYGIIPDQFNKIEPFIEIPENKPVTFRKNENKFTSKKVIQKLNINKADTIQLLELPMVGAGRARLIYKYRESLGGFVEVNQLLEVFALDSATYEKIKPLVEIDTSVIKRFNINDDNLKHPYVSRQLSKVIKAYRKQHGNFSHITELKQISLITDQIYSKLVPYVAFE